MTRIRFDMTLIAIATLLIVQSSLASAGARLVRDVATRTHARLVDVANVGGR
jgi:hypothetical protein